MADALSRKAGSMGSLAHLPVSRRPLAREVQTLDNDLMRLEVNEKGGFLVCVEARSSFLDKIKAVKSWVRPTNVSEVRRFVGLASYYR